MWPRRPRPPAQGPRPTLNVPGPPARGQARVRRAPRPSAPARRAPRPSAPARRAPRPRSSGSDSGSTSRSGAASSSNAGSGQGGASSGFVGSSADSRLTSGFSTDSGPGWASVPGASSRQLLLQRLGLRLGFVHRRRLWLWLCLLHELRLRAGLSLVHRHRLGRRVIGLRGLRRRLALKHRFIRPTRHGLVLHRGPGARLDRRLGLRLGLVHRRRLRLRLVHQQGLSVKSLVRRLRLALRLCLTHPCRLSIRKRFLQLRFRPGHGRPTCLVRDRNWRHRFRLVSQSVVLSVGLGVGVGVEVGVGRRNVLVRTGHSTASRCVFVLGARPGGLEVGEQPRGRSRILRLPGCLVDLSRTRGRLRPRLGYPSPSSGAASG